MKKAELLRLARVGAAARLAELQREMEAIHQSFAELRSGRSAQPQNPYTAGVRSAVAGVRGAVEGAVKRRRTLTPDARKRISDAQKTRWAKQRRSKR